MFPYFTIYWQDIFIFWITLVVSFFLFLWMLKKLSSRFNYDYNIIINSILWYFLSVFIFSRLFYIISMWKDTKYIDSIFDFFVTSDYNFSLFWALFWFFVVFFLKLRLFKKNVSNYLDWVVLSFLFILIIWFIGAFFWWQVYGSITTSWIWVYYSATSWSQLSWLLFPLALIYSGIFFIQFIVFYILSLYIKTRWIIWYVWLGVFSSIILGMEFLSWKRDIFKSMYNFNFSQICALVFIVLSFYGLFTVILKEKKWENIILWKQD